MLQLGRAPRPDNGRPPLMHAEGMDVPPQRADV